jgi:hypothetical protein
MAIGSAGGSRRRSRRAWVVGAALLACGGAVLALVFWPGSSKRDTMVATKTTAPLKATTTAATTTTRVESKPRREVEPLSLEVYDRRADLICATFDPEISRAESEANFPRFLSALEREWRAIAALPRLSSDGAEMKRAIGDADRAIGSLRMNDDAPTAAEEVAANDLLLAAHTTEGILGMKVCNFGH